MTDNVTGYGVPLTTAQRVARFGARISPTIRGGLPQFALDENLEATYRETVLLNYEDLDAKGRKLLSDAQSWKIFAIVGAIVPAVVWALVPVGVTDITSAIIWTVLGVVDIALSIPYRRVERRKHAELVEKAKEYLAPFIDSGKARYI